MLKFFFILLSELHCFSYFYQIPLSKYFVLCFYIQRKHKQRQFIDSRNYSRQYYFRQIRKKKTILKISSIRFLRFCSGQESQSKGIELRSQLTKQNNCGGGIPKFNFIFIIIFTITICNIN